MKTSYLFPVLFFCVICFLPSCENDKVVTHAEYYSPDEYQILRATLELPAEPYAYGRLGFGSSNKTDAIGTLGRVLFYDKNLSSDNSVSCGSCHQQHLGFADDDAFSKGVHNRITARNTLSLGSFRSFGEYSEDPQTNLFWDNRVKSLHDQMIQTIRNPNEMGLEMKDVVAKIKDLDYYKILAQKAFFDENLNEELVLFAIENFITSIQSETSKFDIVASHNSIGFTAAPWSEFNEQENMGKRLFMDNCVSCHNQGLSVFTNDFLRSANNGLDLEYADKGEGEVNPSPDALAIFKIPGLRNIALTAPYMHDGRFGSLEQVLDFYSSGIQDHPNLNPLLKSEDGHAKKFNFTTGEKDALIQFLNTLTDNTMTSEVKWSNPFL
ncbi:MAG TPA: cytochrome c peroxidase [Saprospiraceae bacterium]|nr:cytochrome c peroxidase [Saprospiraceae bacterium]